MQCLSRRLLLVVLFAGMNVHSGRAAEPPRGERIFSAGHSFHMFLPPLLAELANQGMIVGHEQVGVQSIGGSRTQQHWDLPDDKNKAKEALKTGKVDVLTLSPHIKLPDEGIDNFVKLALEKNPKARIFVQGSWMLFDDPANLGKKFTNEDRNSANLPSLVKAYEPFSKAMHEQIAAINKRYEPEFKRSVVFLVPVGPAVMALREKIVAGEAPGIAKQSDLFTDALGHAGPAVQVLNAYCHYAAIYKQSPVGLPVPERLRTATKAEELTKLLQELAWEAVKNEPASGVR